MNIEQIIAGSVKKALKDLYGEDIEEKLISVIKTRKEFEGDLTVVIFPLLRFSKKSPDETALEIGDYLKKNLKEISSYNIVKGFLNLVISDAFWLSSFYVNLNNKNVGEIKNAKPKTILVEYSSPNTNKPLHLGHVRNNLLGWSISQILKANGHNVVMVNLVNDRGIHICKSMLAYQKYGNGEEPSDKIKGDHLVGKYYVEFEKHYRKEVNKLIQEGLTKEEAEKKAPLLVEAQDMLRKWEAKDEEIITLWKKMNSWVYKGFDETYKHLGVEFDKIYYESNTYILGKELVKEALVNDILFKKDDGSVWIDLTQDKLDEKLLLRADGTSVYMTQDLGTAVLRYNEYKPDEMIYVVGNEQEYHFNVLKILLRKFGYKWHHNIQHLSYGMVELPEGKMKSREGTVVDADELMDEMIATANAKTSELGKIEGFTKAESDELHKKLGLGALKYFILKVDPKKNMLFNPEESIDFNGNTGPFIQYSYARVQSVLRKANEMGIDVVKDVNYSGNIEDKEKELIKLIYSYETIIKEAGNSYSPALIANYIYELAKNYNQFYHDIPILKETNDKTRMFRLQLSELTARIIKSSMELLGVGVPDRM